VPDFKKYWNIVHNKGSKKAEILIYEQIGAGFWSEGIGAKQFAKDLKDLGDIEELDIRINSPGGSVFEGLSIYNLLVLHRLGHRHGRPGGHARERHHDDP